MERRHRRCGLALLGLVATGAQAGYYPGYAPQGWYPPVYQAPPAYQQPRAYPRPPAYAPLMPRYQPVPYGYPPRTYAPAPRPQPASAPTAKTLKPEAPQTKPEPKPAADPTPQQSSTGGATDAETNKAQFLETVLPLVRQHNESLRRDRARLLSLIEEFEAGRTLPGAQQQWLRELGERFKVEADPLSDAEARQTLMRRVDVIPADLALAQAAHESAWGRSRFAREANNLFGIWTFDAEQGLKPERRESGKKHFVRVFDSLAESVGYYLHTLNTHPAYRSLRKLRESLRSKREPLRGEVLAAGLSRYSGRAEAYVKDIRTLIRQNDLTRYNHIELAAAETRRDG